MGVSVVDATSGETLFAHNADQMLNPASCAKLLTTLAALQDLGPSHTFATEVFVTAPPIDGIVTGDVVVRGEGDPSLTLERVWRMADLVRRAGIRRVTGRVVIDESAFDGERETPGSGDFGENRAYTALNGAVSFNWNTVAFAVRPGAKPGAPAVVVMDPPTTYVALTNRATTKARGSQLTLSAIPEGKTFVISGGIPVGYPEKVLYRAIDSPAAFAGHLFKEYLASVGVEVQGGSSVGTTPPHAERIVRWDSPPLGAIVRELNKFSSNFVAEQLTKYMGYRLTGKPGTTQDGVESISKNLAAHGISPQKFSIRNGSGLSRTNQVPPAVLTEVLRLAWNDFRVRPEYTASLGIFGHDGTVSRRLKATDADSYIRAKTGSIDGVSCLAGYAHARNGQVSAFAVVVNGSGSAVARAQTLQDKIALALTRWPGTARERSADSDSSAQVTAAGQDRALSAPHVASPVLTRSE